MRRPMRLPLCSHTHGPHVAAGPANAAVGPSAPLRARCRERRCRLAAQARLVLCHVTRRVTEEGMQAAAAAAGLQPVALEAAAAAAAQLALSGALRLLVFSRTPAAHVT